MNDDMKRLCLSANRVVRGRGPSEDCGPLPDGRVEAIVRAVLAELREPSEAMLTEGLHERNVSGTGARGLPLCFKRMVDAVLS